MAGALSDARHIEPPSGAEPAFVGRTVELAALQAGLRDVAAGHGRLFLVVGEAGIGKTRIVEELAAHARAVGAQVLFGRCREGEGAPACWPWIEAIRTLLRYGDAERLRADMGSSAAELAQVIPEVRALVPDVPPPPPLEPEQARFRLFDGLATFLRNLASRQPLVVVLDDLHSADRQSLLMLQFLTHQIASARVLVAGTYRDADYGRDHPLFQTVGELSRELVTRRLPLARLGEADVGRYIEAVTGVAASPALVAAVHSETEGNPFFLGEVVRLLMAEGRAAERGAWRPRVPEGARAVIARRLSGLSAECNEVLAVGSVIGREFGLAVLQRVADTPHDRLLAALDEAAAHRVIAELPGSVGRYRFSHALIREALHDELPLPRRTVLHRQIGDTLERASGADPRALAAELAYHFVEAARGGSDPEPAIRYATLAAERAVLQLAYEDAAVHYERALGVIDASGGGTAADRMDLLLALGEAQRWSGAVTQARDTFQAAAASARARGSTERLARAALGFALGTEAVAPGVTDAAVVALLEEALRALGDDHPGLRAAVQTRLAAELQLEPPAGRRARLARDAVDLARRAGDPAALARALSDARFVLWWPENHDERLALSSEMVAIAEAVGHQELAFRGHVWRLTDVLELGDMAAADAEVAACARLAEALKAPFYRAYVGVFRAARALLEGRFEDAEQQAAEAAAVGMRAQSPWAPQVFSAQMFSLRREQGRFAELGPAMVQVPEAASRPVYACARALVHAELGARDLAREELERLAAHDFDDLRRDTEWLLSVVYLADVCAFLGDAARAARLYALLRPLAGRAFVLGNAFGCMGAIDRNLGQLAAVMARWDDGVRHFEAALDMNARMRARPFLARTQYEYARMLAARGDSGDAARSGALLARALETAQELGMPWLAEKVLAAQGERRAPSAGAAAPPQRALFVREGDVWTIGYPGAVFRLRDSLGLRYLATMLREPERTFPSTQLAGTAVPGVPSRPHDARRARAHAERARVNVTRAIKAAIARIARHDPSLGRYLATTVRTGTACCYTPDLRLPVSWKL